MGNDDPDVVYLQFGRSGKEVRSGWGLGLRLGVRRSPREARMKVEIGATDGLNCHCVMKSAISIFA